jgi:hypothetical protein
LFNVIQLLGKNEIVPPCHPSSQPIGKPDERTANVPHRRHALSNALIDRIREPAAGLFIWTRLPDDGRQRQHPSPQILYLSA